MYFFINNINRNFIKYINKKPNKIILDIYYK